MIQINSGRLKYVFLSLLLLAPCYVAAQQKEEEAKDSKKAISSNERLTDLKSPDQSSEDEQFRKFEIGGHYTIMFQDDFEVADVVFSRAGIFDSVLIDRRYESGFGGRFTYNINQNLALEGEINFTPSTRTLQELATAGIPRTGPLSGGEKTQFLAGVKYGIRKSKFGVFGKIRPGAIRFNAFPSIDAKFVVPSPSGTPKDILLIVTEKPATFFNVDVGGVFEYYPSKRTIIRFDVGDTIIRYNAQEPKDINPTFTRHNLQINIGFGFRF